ncbi:MAG: hypothetical protein NKF37_03730 [Tropheryma whipplei]|nr:hypothetical protein [Tropheryma whipplei]
MSGALRKFLCRIRLRSVLLSLSVVFLGFLLLWINIPPPTPKYAISDRVFRDITKLIASDGLATLPELGDENTLDSRVHATYLIAVMTEEGRKKELGRLLSVKALRAYATDNNKPDQYRLEAYYAMQVIDDSENGIAFARSVMARQPRTIETLSQLHQYLSVAAAAIRLDPSIYRPALRLRNMQIDNGELLAIVMKYVPLGYMFSNFRGKDSVLFPALRSELTKWTDSPSVAKFLVGMISLSGTPYSVSYNTKAEIAKGFIGCRTSNVMISTTGEKSADCSLTNTYYFFYMNGFGYGI